ncbi:maltose alpha-D-glucosyltransferase [Burkholderia multivorans]|uniref:Maltokinase n=1 Tax=Burkholderia multivorans TaxID=87883 RepID=A0A8E2RXX2_9BURK|nr:maltose alpha-D-glucosyltransferase [Burkholderia multivorans]MDN8091599.1 maltose alpha-D-glucosyltransferase [Burkholderia multivorans]MDN8097699.1 maltose alpha-D-glucosyltransferase [Burkholderia multivorans]MDN8108542.1 maltose alpha-D-glucosyltransferase [Burkholderia multivorans]MDN8132529.1 maltose alpha-D-glucosyltransferase [Burkholderia multivorans]PRF26065.1 maltose alpha-D-glucosyltransferase [Burkholderia multivorans]
MKREDSLDDVRRAQFASHPRAGSPRQRRVRRPAPALCADDPLWYKDAIIYQVHVKSFFDSNNDGIGDFPGLIAKLDYIAELGVDAIWLLPFYPSPRRDDGYDISDYRDVHPDYGTLADVRRFIREAHARGIRVITELVINHTSDQHPWFQRARRAKPGSMYRNYYVWSDTDTKYAGTRIIFLDTETSNWTHDPVAGQYYWHRFYSHQPDLNFDNPAVVREVLQVMRFWLDLGIDGLRLDAVPYLVEREGTNNENLPETHAILKRIRATIDAEYPNRMLLAEANQWPEDVQEYFGNEDECHMAFHFPLMPRIYMSIASEDRFPIIDIMRQTPALAPSNQWAVFLRNHDELTLEMVTDSERDLLWQTYASDRRARLNLGIRRRLAPLMERDRRRIELINSLLLSMPGTPVIYYGDEIGMGDNIHLGDRDGVRTPMQWSSDRNGGFSLADPELLVLPPVMGSLYGYDAINVEAQTRDPHSLLNWTRRILATRRATQVFGRGSIRFLRPENRKVLAYLRELEGHDPVLCVANLSRASQAVELDLSEFAGRVPIEMTSDSPFPPVGQLPYLLTFPPYGFLWFVLSAHGREPAWRQPHAEPLPEYVTLVMRRGDTRPDVAQLHTLAHDALASWLTRRRWFASKDRTIADARLNVVTPIPGESFQYAEACVTVRGDSHAERYVVPLAVAWGGETSGPLFAQLALARVRRGHTVGYLTDAFALPAFAHGMLRKLRAGATVPTSDGGHLAFLPEAALASLDPGDEAEVRWLAAEQSNSSLVIGEAIVLKLVRKVAHGVHPEAEMSRHLTRIGYQNTAALAGEVVHVDPDGRPHTVAILQRFVDNQGDAWTRSFDFLKRAVDELALPAADDADTTEPDAETDALLGYAAFAGVVGKRLGELHVALAQPSDDPAFAPERATPEHVDGWCADAIASFEQALDCLGTRLDGLDADTRAAAERLLASRDAAVRALGELVPRTLDAHCTRIHGDFHLGQVLDVQGDALLIDFEGEPARALERRRAKSHPLRDVAGFLRSLSYVSATGQFAIEKAPPQAADRKRALFERFGRAAADAFVDCYRAAAEHAPVRFVDPRYTDRLLALFLIDKASYELCYEAANRPDWLCVPVGGLAALVERLLEHRGAEDGDES